MPVPRTTRDERTFALGCRLLELFCIHGLPQELRASLSDKQRAQTHAFQCQVVARNIARGFVKQWERDDENEAQNERGSR